VHLVGFTWKRLYRDVRSTEHKKGQIFLPSIRKLHKSFSLPVPSALHVMKCGPNEKLTYVKKSMKFHALRSVKQVTVFIAFGSLFRGDTTYSYFLQDITYCDIWVSSVGVKYIKSFVEICLRCKLWKNYKQVHSIAASFTWAFSYSIFQAVSEVNISLLLMN